MKLKDNEIIDKLETLEKEHQKEILAYIKKIEKQ